MRLLGGHVKHIVSQDAEAVDPFVLSVRVSKDGSPVAVLEREVHDGDGTMLLDMTPLQRLQTGRRPTGFDPDVKLPDWARDVLPEDVRDVPTGAFASTWLTGRARLLGRDLRERMDEAAGSWSRASIDEVVSLAERLVLVSVPKGTTLGWLPLRFHYGHTVSGELQQHDGGTLLEVIRRRTGVPLSVAPGERGGSNGQWLARYSLGVMDTDSPRNLVYGEVLIPVATEAVDGVRWSGSWDVRSDTATTVATVACRFDSMTRSGAPTRWMVTPAPRPCPAGRRSRIISRISSRIATAGRPPAWMG
jgi:hypothetical protein